MNIILIVSEGYPLRFSANNSKAEFIARGLKEYGCNITMIDNPFGTKGIDKEISGVSEKGINYYIFPRKGKLSTLIKNIPRIYKILNEKKQGKDNFVILGMTLYPVFIILALISTRSGYKRTASFHEWHIGCKQPNLLYKIEAWLKDKTFGFFLDGIFPISHFLQEKAKIFNKPQLLLPIMASYNRKICPYQEKNSFTFCGHAEYLIRNQILLNAFKKVVEEVPTAQLILVLFGNKKQMDAMFQLIQSLNIKNIEIKNQIPQEELYRIYDESLGLLIPLDPDSLQDKARFSQKIAEYVGSKRPLITNNVGEISYYFIHQETAEIISYDVNGFYKGMKELINNHSLANKIGEKGFEVGKKYFNYKTVSDNIQSFLKTI